MASCYTTSRVTDMGVWVKRWGSGRLSERGYNLDSLREGRVSSANSTYEQCHHLERVAVLMFVLSGWLEHGKVS